MTTPHIAAPDGAFAPTVLLPGDPLRARHIAERFLTGVEQVTAVRNMFGYTGHYRDRRISVMGTGMGIPSCSIYATELVRHYGVRRLVRVGTCGALRADVNVGDIVLAQGASTDSGVNRARLCGCDLAALASYALLRQVADTAGQRGVPVRIGGVFSTDSFYGGTPGLHEALERLGVLGIEMEAAGLYGVAAEHDVEALAVLTISDHIRSGASMSPTERATGVDAMVELVLESGI